MKCISKTLLAAAIAMQASFAQALGLGDITLRSALDEPLKAEIRLRGVGDLDASQIVVSLADPADFKRAGVERLYSLSELHFEVDLSKGDGVIRLRTERPVREPYLDFVVEVRWPTGRVLREYTVLLDLPAMTPAPAPEVRVPSASRPGASASRPAAPSRSSGGGTWTGGDSYDVRSGDTLWSIANRTRPSGVSVQQMMVTLQRSNPEAFIRGNMNLLRAGAILRISADASISQSEAVGEVESQGRDWRSGGTEPAAPRERTVAAATTAGATTPAERAYLELAAGAAGGSGSASGGESSGSGNGSLQAELTAAQENLSAKDRENAELQSRVNALEQQVQNYERLVELKSEGGAAAQQAAGAAAQGPDAAGEAAGAATAATTAQSAPVTAPVPAVTPAPEEPGLLQKLMSNTMALAALAGLLVIAVIAFLFSRRRAAASYAPVPAPTHALRTAAAKPAETGVPARQEPRIVERPAPAAPEVAAAPVAAVAAGTAAVTAVAAAPDVSDPVSEADIYVAYGRIERALDILRTALAQDPGRSDVRLKLMEVLADSGNQEAFLEQYEELLAHGEAEAIEAAHELLDDRGMAGWILAEPDPEPVSVAPASPAWSAPVAPAPAPMDEEEQELARLETEGGILHLDQDVELDLDQELARASEEPSGDDELALEIGELELDAGPAVGADADDLDLGGVGDLELGDDSAAVLAPLDVEPVVEAHGGGSTEEEADLGLLEGADEIETKLELARAYVDMGDLDGARDILDEVVAEGSVEQREQAGAMLERIRSA